MIFSMVRDVQTALHARKWPVAFEYGPTRLGRSAPASMRVQFSRDTVDGDKDATIVAVQRNPRKQSVRMLGVVAVVSVQSPKAGAMQHEHEHLCDDLVDALTTEIGDWCVASKTLQPEWVELRYLSEEEFSGAELGAGVHYILRFRIARAVCTRDFDGGILPTGDVGSVVSETHVTVDGQREEVI